ncbi:LOW QUALITY PROTEIN: hypothetical protein PHPALM_31188 [Phytophthora palmivora]|uniref:Centromere protein S n=1 Tax=Phytophthora palmivora TaxID=4796 RepID=A0A2P4X388_9STRA|nr:LOW QUALITY PROTEIN: hypothetical protein PHPALM_31188 [Phytophthora palmivora]
MSKEAMALLADLVYKQSEGCQLMATELQFFARHANRKIIKTEDVTLCARKHPNLVTKARSRLFNVLSLHVAGVLTNLLQKYQRENLNSSSTTNKKRRRNVADSD